MRKETDADGNTRYFDDDGKFHREDGFAMERPSGHACWYIHGTNIGCRNSNGPYYIVIVGGDYKTVDTEEEFMKWMSMKAFW
jgi:hypothetical protein